MELLLHAQNATVHVEGAAICPDEAWKASRRDILRQVDVQTLNWLAWNIISAPMGIHAGSFAILGKR